AVRRDVGRAGSKPVVFLTGANLHRPTARPATGLDVDVIALVDDIETGHGGFQARRELPHAHAPRRHEIARLVRQVIAVRHTPHAAVVFGGALATGDDGTRHGSESGLLDCSAGYGLLNRASPAIELATTVAAHRRGHPGTRVHAADEIALAVDRTARRDRDKAFVLRCKPAIGGIQTELIDPPV